VKRKADEKTYIRTKDKGRARRRKQKGDRSCECTKESGVKRDDLGPYIKACKEKASGCDPEENYEEGVSQRLRAAER